LNCFASYTYVTSLSRSLIFPVAHSAGLLSAKTRAPKNEFREPLQADLGCPDLSQRIFLFRFFRN
jgi:hypothetical protein